MAHGFAGANEVPKAAGFKNLVVPGHFRAEAQRLDQGGPQFAHIDRRTEVRIGSDLESLLFDGARHRAADGNEGEINVETPQFVEDAKAADRVFALGVDIEDDRGVGVLLLRPLRQAVIFRAPGHAAPWFQFRWPPDLRSPRRLKPGRLAAMPSAWR